MSFRQLHERVVFIYVRVIWKETLLKCRIINDDDNNDVIKKKPDNSQNPSLRVLTCILNSCIGV